MIATKVGDAGSTRLHDKMVPKTDKIIVTFGEIDETISSIVLSIAHIEKLPDDYKQLEQCIYDLHDISAYIGGYTDKINLTKQIKEMEDFIYMKEVVDFTYPIEHKAGAFLNMARSVARRAERALLDYLDWVHYLDMQEKDYTDVLKYMNRLSDYLFALSVDVRGL